MVSQSFDAKTTVKVSMTTMTTTEFVAHVSCKLDLEKFNFRIDGTMDMSIGKTMHMHTDSKMLVNAATKMFVQSTKVIDTDSGKVMSNNCTARKVKDMPAPRIFSVYFKSLVRKMQELATCGGNDGTYDTWKFEKSYDGPIPSIPGHESPLPPGTVVDGSVSEKLQMTKDSILHSSTTSVSAKVTAPNGTVLEDVHLSASVDTSNAKAGGPSTEDMDYSGWGDCKAPPSGEELDFETLFKVASAPMQGLYSRDIVQNLDQKHVLAALQAGLKAQKTKTVVV